MKKSLNYLPKTKRDELKTVVRMIREEFIVEIIILFGSYARNEWVEELGEDEFHYKYQSDFDLFVVADRKDADKHGKWDRLEDRIIRSSVVLTPVTLIHHSIEFLNNRLSKGHYFFTDIIKEGILLYDSKRVELAEPKELTPEETKNRAEKYFEQWYISANEFYRTTFFEISNGSYNKAAFELHQAAERYYSAVLLVLTDYRPRTHDLKKLSMALLRL